ncbi:MAG: trehalose-6-phosphate synthase [Patescibacteria group bacterium]
MKQTIFTTFILTLIVSLVILFFTLQQVAREQQRLTTDLQYRTTLLADSLKERAEPYMISNNAFQLQRIINQFVEEKRISGVAIYDNKDNVIASSEGMLIKNLESIDMIVANAMDEDKLSADFAKDEDKKTYVFALPLHQDTNVIGSLVLVQNAGFIDDRLNEIWKNNLVRLGIQDTLIILAVILTVRFIIYQPIKDIAEAIRLSRTNQNSPNPKPLPHNFILKPLIRELSQFTKSLYEARQAVREEARTNIENIDSPWTEQRLHEYVKKILESRSVYVVSNREPYIHTKKNNSIGYFVPASGMVTAIEPMIEACGGTWIASGSGDADRLVVDKDDKVRVPPDEPKYTLKRVWLTEEEEKKYYYGFANEGLWPLCHMAHTRPVFREDDWEVYKSVNGKFASTLLKEIHNIKKPIIVIQDYHFSLLPRMIKDARPDTQIVLFWHIPWPNPEAFGICPFRKEILDGMLGADLIGFHTQLHCNNFIETVGRELESLIDLEQFSVTKNSHRSLVKSFPISIAFNDSKEFKPVKTDEILEKMDIRKTKYIGVGVDRLDYTKGILERLMAIELLLKRMPFYKNHFTFIQIAPPSRSKIKAYHDLEVHVEKEVDRINNLYKNGKWQPIVLLKKHHNHEEIGELYKIANVCLVTSLHDGMNLVAKEFVAARGDERGVLILSKFAGASRELKDALIVNPYDGNEVADAINQSLQMGVIEQSKRMKRMRMAIKRNDIYKWSANLLRDLINLG